MNKLSKEKAIIVLNFIANAERLRAEQVRQQTITPSEGICGQVFRRSADKTRLVHDSRQVAR